MPDRGSARQALARVSLLDAESAGGGWLSESLRGEARTPVPRRVAFALDFHAWRASLPPGKRAVLDALAAGGRTGEVAEQFGLSAGRVSQIRSELARGWRAFCAG